MAGSLVLLTAVPPMQIEEAFKQHAEQRRKGSGLSKQVSRPGVHTACLVSPVVSSARRLKLTGLWLASWAPPLH